MKRDLTRAVIHRRDGVRIGPYEAHQEYRVDPDEAARLVEAKGFEYADQTAAKSSEETEQ